MLFAGKDKRIMPLLYALAVYGVSEAEIKEVDIPLPDKEIIKKVCIKDKLLSKTHNETVEEV